MVIDGKKIALEIENSLRLQISSLASHGIQPALAVILIGSDPSSQKYVSRKIITGEKINLRVIPYRFPPTIPVFDLKELIEKLNQDKTIHGIIIQRPVPLEISPDELNFLVSPSKDVDGFHPKSQFNPPVALAVEAILKSIHPANFPNWLKNKNIVVIGRGETAGKPIAKYLKKINLKFTVAHSQTKNLNNLISVADIIISCVGKPDIVRHSMLKKSSILIGVGLHPEVDKLQPDYNQEEIKEAAGFYTPVPGGVGPVNVVMLMKNVIKAAEITLI